MIKIDASELSKLSKGLDQYRTIIPKSVSNQALRKSARPMLRSAQRLVPTGRTIAPDGWGAKKGATFARGRATARDLREKIVSAKPGEISRVIIGVSKAKGRVGWRTHFITRGFTDRGGRFHRPDNFLQNAYNYTIDIVRANYSGEILLSFRKWAKRNLPQGRF